MARGWESKAVEEQQAEALTSPSDGRHRPTPEQISHRQQYEGLLLSKKRILGQLETAQNPQYRKMLEKALADLEAQLTRLG